MPKLTNSLTSRFVAHSKKLENTRLKVEGLLASGHVEISDTEQVYTGLYLDIFTEFESMIENLFLGLLSGQLYSRICPVKRRIKMKPSSMVQEVVFAGRPYLDWLPYRDRTIRRANIYFSRGKPFTVLSDSQMTNIDSYHVIRNALAHKSDSALKRFYDTTSGLTLLPQERSPAGYLRSTPYSTSPQTQYEIAVIELVAIIRLLCS